MTMMQELIAYGDTGKEDSLIAIIALTAAKSSFGRVSNALATRIIARFLDVFKSTFLSDKRRPIWHVLSILCNVRANLSSEDFKSKLDNTPSILNYVVEACENYPRNECFASLDYLHEYILENDNRQTMVLRKTKLISTLMVVFDASIAALDYPTIRVVAMVFRHVLYSTGPVEAFIKPGGFIKLNIALERLVTSGVNEYINAGLVDDKLLRALAQVLYALSQAQKAMRTQLNLLDPFPSIESSLYYYTLKGAKDYAQLLANAADILPDDVCRTAILSEFHDTYRFIADFTVPDNDGSTTNGGSRLQTREDCKIEALEHYLTCSDRFSNCSLPVRVIRLVRDEDIINGVPTANLLPPLEEISVILPSVESAFEVEIGEKLVYCALPACNVSNLKRGRLKKCVRCMGVSYCGKEHQVVHWKEHKPECKRIVADPLAAVASAVGDSV